MTEEKPDIIENKKEEEKKSPVKNFVYYSLISLGVILLIVTYVYLLTHELISGKVFLITLVIVIVAVCVTITAGIYYRAKQRKSTIVREMTDEEAHLQLKHNIQRKYSEYNITLMGGFEIVPIQKEKFKFGYQRFRLNNGSKFAELINKVSPQATKSIDITDYTNERQMEDVISSVCSRLAGIEKEMKLVSHFDDRGNKTGEERVPINSPFMQSNFQNENIFA